MLDLLPSELIYQIILYLTPYERYILRHTCYYLFINGWLQDEIDYCHCDNRSIKDGEQRCYQQDHLNCVKFFPVDKSVKYHNSIIYVAPKIYNYYKQLNITLDINSCFKSIIFSSNERALLLISDDTYLMGRLSFHIESIIRNSSISFIKLIIKLIYSNDYKAFYDEFSGEIDEIERDKLSMLFHPIY